MILVYEKEKERNKEEEKKMKNKKRGNKGTRMNYWVLLGDVRTYVNRFNQNTRSTKKKKK